MQKLSFVYRPTWHPLQASPVAAVLADQRVGGAPNIEFGNHALSMAICGTPVAEEDRPWRP
jgi:hypothetical protein